MSSLKFTYSFIINQMEKEKISIGSIVNKSEAFFELPVIAILRHVSPDPTNGDIVFVRDIKWSREGVR